MTWNELQSIILHRQSGIILFVDIDFVEDQERDGGFNTLIIQKVCISMQRNR
jgi:hypothetical protein